MSPVVKKIESVLKLNYTKEIMNYTILPYWRKTSKVEEFKNGEKSDLVVAEY